MKLRINGNSVRYRLSQSEVQKFSEDGYLEEKLNFISAQFIYVLEAKKGITNIEVDYASNKLTMYFPFDEKQIWRDTDRVGYSNKIQITEANIMSILLEKDFVCLDEVEEDQSDNFPNPKLKC